MEYLSWFDDCLCIKTQSKSDYKKYNLIVIPHLTLFKNTEFESLAIDLRGKKTKPNQTKQTNKYTQEQEKNNTQNFSGHNCTWRVNVGSFIS